MNLELLREIRKGRGVTQEQLAFQLGYKSKSAYNNLESGLTRISTETANEIARILEMTPEQKLEVFLPD